MIYSHRQTDTKLRQVVNTTRAKSETRGRYKEEDQQMREGRKDGVRQITEAPEAKYRREERSKLGEIWKK